MLLVQRFDVRPEDEVAFLERARHALALLGEQPGCSSVELGKATDEPATRDARRWTLVAVFSSVAAYRRALSPFAVREHVVPFLSDGLVDQPATFERRLSTSGDGVTEHSGILS